MKKRETFSEREELLVKALEECMDEDLSFVPPSGEIARGYRFSEEFETAMGELLDSAAQEQREKTIRRHFRPRYASLAACLLLFGVCGFLLWTIAEPLSQTSSRSADTAAEETVAEEETEEAAMVTEDALETDTGTASGTTESAEPEVRNWNGQTVELAEEQDVPEALENVAARVSDPVLEQDDQGMYLYLTIENLGADSIRYWDSYGLQVWLDDGWYVVDTVNASWQSTWQELEAGTAVDAEIDLTAYELDFTAERYRLIVHTEDADVSAEFTFSAFSE